MSKLINDSRKGDKSEFHGTIASFAGIGSGTGTKLYRVWIREHIVHHSHRAGMAAHFMEGKGWRGDGNHLQFTTVGYQTVVCLV